MFLANVTPSQVTLAGVAGQSTSSYPVKSRTELLALA